MTHIFASVLTVFLITAFPGHLWACDRFLSAAIESSREVCELYEELNCGSNTHKILYQMAKKVGMGALAKSEVLILYRPDFQQLQPRNTRTGVENWNYHVVLRTQYGVIDLDSRAHLDGDYHPVPISQYFSDLFPENSEFTLAKLSVVAVPAIDYFNNWPDPTTRPSALALAVSPQGWLTKYYERNMRVSNGVTYIGLKQGTPSYYFLTRPGRRSFPPQNLLQYLDERKSNPAIR